jgi:putative transposase
VRAPRIDDRRIDSATGERMHFRSSILPPWARKSPKVTDVLPLMYLHGMSSGDFAPALEEFFGSAAGLSASVITRLTTEWQAERDTFSRRSLKDTDYVYVFADGIHFRVRLEEARLCTLVIVGVRSDGTKELVSISDGHRESTESRSRHGIRVRDSPRPCPSDRSLRLACQTIRKGPVCVFPSFETPVVRSPYGEDSPGCQC